jgi:hypothetical protein
VVYALTSPRQWVYRIDVGGLDTLTEGEVLGLAAVPPRTNTWRAPLRKIGARVNAGDPRIAEARARWIRGGVLAIDVRERQPVCRLGEADPPAYLDATGHLFTRPAPPRTAVPIVEGAPALGDAPAWGSVPTSAEVTAALQVTAALRQAGGDMTPQVKRIVVAPMADQGQTVLKLVLDDGTPVYLGPPLDLDLKVSVARFTLTRARELRYGPGRLDYIVVRYVDPKHTSGGFKVKGEGTTITVDGGGQP